MKLHTLAAALSLVLAGAAFAQAPAPNTPRVDKREANQQKRIDQGVASGQINQKEAARLENGQARVAATEDKAKADGTVTKNEKAHLTKMQNKQDRHIKREKHDRQKATPAG